MSTVPISASHGARSIHSHMAQISVLRMNLQSPEAMTSISMSPGATARMDRVAAEITPTSFFGEALTTEAHGKRNDNLVSHPPRLRRLFPHQDRLSPSHGIPVMILI